MGIFVCRADDGGDDKGWFVYDVPADSLHSLGLIAPTGPPPISQVIFVTLIYWKIPLIPFKEVTTVRGGEGQSGRDSVKETDDPFWRRSSQLEQTHFCPLQDTFWFSLARIAGVPLRFQTTRNAEMFCRSRFKKGFQSCDSCFHQDRATAGLKRGNFNSGSPRRKTDERERQHREGVTHWSCRGSTRRRR